VELVYGLHVRWVACEALRGYNVLAGVVAFGGTIPEEETAVEGWTGQEGFQPQTKRDSRIGVGFSPQLASLHIYTTCQQCI
jgi:hypothetical protein